MLSQRSATLLGLLALVFWTTSVAVVRRLVAPGAAGPLTYLAVTSLAAGTLLGLYQVLRTPPGVRRRPTGKYLLIGGACFVAYFGMYTISLHMAPSHPVVVQLGLVNYLWPPMVLLLSVPLLGNRANWPVLLAGVALAVGGAGLAATTQGLTAKALFAGIAANCLPFALMALAAVAWGAYSNFAKRYHAEGAASGVSLFLVVIGLAALAARQATGEVSHWDAATIGWFVYASIFPSALGYFLWETGMRAGKIPVLASASYLLPVTSTLFTCLLLNVPPTGRVLAGAALVVAGAVLSGLAVKARAGTGRT